MSEAVAQLEAALQLLTDLKQGRPCKPDQLPTTLVDVEAVARYLGVSTDYVYRHADELGARRLPSAGYGRGKGTKRRLRFSLPELDERLQARTTCSSSRESDAEPKPVAKPIRRPRRRRRLGTNPPPLPIR